MALEWAMIYGDAEGWLLDEAAAGDPVALKAVNARPEIEPHLKFVWAAFWELCHDRPVTMGGAGGIPFSSIDRYAARAGIDDPDHFARFLQLIRRMDAAYLPHVNKREGS